MHKFGSFLIILLISTSHAQYDINTNTEDEDPEIESTDVEEPGCQMISDLRNITLEEILGQWHLPYMSSNWIDYMTKSMHGVNAKYTHRSSMGQMCVKVNVKELVAKGTPTNAKATIWLQSKCPHTAFEWSLACAPFEALTSKWFCNDLKGTTKVEDSYVYVVDTDRKTWALVVRCIPNSGHTWAIFSKVKQLDSDIVKTLLSKVEAMGFKLLFDVIEVPYEKCMTKTIQ